MRTLKQLLELMLVNQQYFSGGMCCWIDLLEIKDIITDEERKVLSSYFYNNKPGRYSSWYAFTHPHRSYWWREGHIKPRIKWIQKQIKLL